MIDRQVHITNKIFDPETAHRKFREALGDSGAIVAFTGLVRCEKDIETLTLSHYPEFTESEIARIGQEAAKRWPLTGWRIIHRVGEMVPREPIVFVATASAHRRAAYEAADFLMDYLKSEAPFWKQERRGGKTHWIDPREVDYADKERWSR